MLYRVIKKLICCSFEAGKECLREETFVLKSKKIALMKNVV